MTIGNVIVAITLGSLLSCTTPHHDDVVKAILNRIDNDGNSIVVSGILRRSSSYYNLFSSDGRECIGILLTDRQMSEYSSIVNHRVTVAGTLEAEGCGREGICVEHLCGPTIMTGVTISR